MSCSRNTLVYQYLSSLRSGCTENQEFGDALGGLDEISVVLARDGIERENVGRSSPKIWEPLCKVWISLAARDINTLTSGPIHSTWTISIARFTRNLVAQNPKNQLEVFKFESAIRTVAHIYTSHIFLEDEKGSKESMTTRFLIQTLSNLVTANEELLPLFWDTHLSLLEEKNILVRVIAHPDDNTASTAFVLIMNCLSGSCERMRLLVDKPIGRRVCIVMLHRLDQYIETSHEDGNSYLFTIGWAIFKTLFDNGFSPSLLFITTMEGEVVNPHQITLLKLIDSYLMRPSAPNAPGEDTSGTILDDIVVSQISEALLGKLFDLMRSAKLSIKCSLGQLNAGSVDANLAGPIAESSDETTSAPLRNLDVFLPKVCETIVLVIQCFCSVALAQNKNGEASGYAQQARRLLVETFSSLGDGLIEELIELLKLLDAFLPRIMFGRASWSTARPDTTSSDQIDKKEDRGFSYLKRDLVRLLGILCYENRAVQDRVRNCHGIPVVMNLCVTDERNPYLREHALFTLRNLLHNNLENQAVVESIKPVGTWDENGVLRDVLGMQR
ncbi:hypothetical protein A7U60_g2847 [Sanghuangporus baumii]|uniref:Ataxin-10 homolog n=1 Tax=Sanghuangporus baumii TaxID=108892 RepID=A0A9Q5I1T8_SANBA|nr:hypothetical protein A7U60_g2847 [Sanghuangporus baumii]